MQACRINLYLFQWLVIYFQPFFTFFVTCGWIDQILNDLLLIANCITYCPYRQNQNEDHSSNNDSDRVFFVPVMLNATCDIILQMAVEGILCQMSNAFSECSKGRPMKWQWLIRFGALDFAFLGKTSSSLSLKTNTSG